MLVFLSMCLCFDSFLSDSHTCLHSTFHSFECGSSLWFVASASKLTELTRMLFAFMSWPFSSLLFFLFFLCLVSHGLIEWIWIYLQQAICLSFFLSFLLNDWLTDWLHCMSKVWSDPFIEAVTSCNFWVYLKNGCVDTVTLWFVTPPNMCSFGMRWI